MPIHLVLIIFFTQQRKYLVNIFPMSDHSGSLFLKLESQYRHLIGGLCKCMCLRSQAQEIIYPKYQTERYQLYWKSRTSQFSARVGGSTTTTRLMLYEEENNHLNFRFKTFPSPNLSRWVSVCFMCSSFFVAKNIIINICNK